MRETEAMKTYHIEIVQQNDGFSPNTHFAHAFGDLDTISYVAKKAGAAIEDVQGNLTLVLNEVDSIGGQSIREVVQVTANAKVVATVLRGELTSERKAAKSAPAESAGENEPVVTDENPDKYGENVSADPQY